MSTPIHLRLSAMQISKQHEQSQQPQQPLTVERKQQQPLTTTSSLCKTQPSKRKNANSISTASRRAAQSSVAASAASARVKVAQSIVRSMVLRPTTSVKLFTSSLLAVCVDPAISYAEVHPDQPQCTSFLGSCAFWIHCCRTGTVPRSEMSKEFFTEAVVQRGYDAVVNAASIHERSEHNTVDQLGELFDLVKTTMSACRREVKMGAKLPSNGIPTEWRDSLRMSSMQTSVCPPMHMVMADYEDSAKRFPESVRAVRAASVGCISSFQTSHRMVVNNLYSKFMNNLGKLTAADAILK